MQTTSHLLMIKPVAFDFNAETAVNNAFQQEGSNENAQQKAEAEFDGFVQKLTAAGVDVTVVQDTPQPHTPDSIFPNNWISFHQDGSIVLYPMYAINRRAERKQHVLDTIAAKFDVKKQIDFTSKEKEDLFLEGTGSMVLDRDNKIAYACLSPRTDKTVFEEWCSKMNYKPCSFYSVDENGGEIYHTNVMMCVADQYVVICLDSIRDATERDNVFDTITDSGKTIIEISYKQMNQFAGNMLQVENKTGQRYLVMSSQAYNALTSRQIQELESFNPIIHSDLTTIETNGGGSARCMMAEVFLPLKK
ncbi:citrulline utilization hydrolase CtlX [Lacibacter sp.]|uniref:citrulline utilization hydrolase CtlX n=1 Tax=Lacibacter sp. TaxID=1915409 RepID=UPI002B4B95D3|nr:arginine deiminase-related protein [Lacibacter sp.]HLP35674.1 arginine deiminase-related protein [Lacibacter sp.]